MSQYRKAACMLQVGRFGKLARPRRRHCTRLAWPMHPPHGGFSGAEQAESRWLAYERRERKKGGGGGGARMHHNSMQRHVSSTRPGTQAPHVDIMSTAVWERLGLLRGQCAAPRRRIQSCNQIKVKEARKCAQVCSRRPRSPAGLGARGARPLAPPRSPHQRRRSRLAGN